MQQNGADMILGVPVGDAVAARNLLTRTLQNAVATARSCERLAMPIAQIACMPVAGIYSRVQWVLDAVAAGVMTDALLQWVVAEEDTSIRRIFGRLADTVPDTVIRQIELPVADGTSVAEIGRAHV